jgi:hypothetical protein
VGTRNVTDREDETRDDGIIGWGSELFLLLALMTYLKSVASEMSIIQAQKLQVALDEGHISR